MEPMLDDTDLLAFAEDVLRSQPFNDQVGARIVQFDTAASVLELDIEDRHRQQFGVVHGGVFAYLVDNALTFACASVLGPDVVTGGLTVTYLASARSGMLRATATPTGQHGRRAVATVTVEGIATDGTVRTCAVGQGTATRRSSTDATPARTPTDRHA